jgi:hypothetical protein
LEQGDSHWLGEVGADAEEGTGILDMNDSKGIAKVCVGLIDR